MRPVWRAVGLLLCAACASAPPAPEGVCRLERARGAEEDIPADAWLRLLLHGYDAKSGQVLGAPLDCTGTPVAWTELDEHCVARTETAPPASKLGPSAVVVASLADSTRLVWVQALRYPDGDAVGPVARVQVRENALVVLATGSARAPAEHSRLRLEPLNGVEVAVLEGDRCEGANCERFARLVPQRGRRFIPEPLRLPDGSCAGPAAFAIKRQKEQPLPSGLRRIFELESTLAFSPLGLTVHEQLFVRDRDPRQPAAPARLYRSAQDDRLVTASAQALAVDKPSLWARLSEFSDAR